MNRSTNIILWQDRSRPFYGLPLSFTRYELTAQKLTEKRGLFRVKKKEILLRDIAEIQVKQHTMQEIHYVGNVYCKRKDETGEIFKIKLVDRPERVAELISIVRNEGEEGKELPRVEKRPVRELRPERYSDKLMIKGKEQTFFVDKKDIILIEHNGNLSNVVTADAVYKTAASLTALEEKLNPEEFMRCHKSYIINTKRIFRIEPYGRWTYVVKFKETDASALITAKNYEEIKRMFE